MTDQKVLISFTVFSVQSAPWNTCSQVPWPASCGMWATSPFLGILPLLLPHLSSLFPKFCSLSSTVLSPWVYTWKTGASLTQPHPHRSSPILWRVRVFHFIAAEFSYFTVLGTLWLSNVFCHLPGCPKLESLREHEKTSAQCHFLYWCLLNINPFSLPMISHLITPAAHNSSFSTLHLKYNSHSPVSLLRLGCVPQLFVMLWSTACVWTCH